MKIKLSNGQQLKKNGIYKTEDGKTVQVKKLDTKNYKIKLKILDTFNEEVKVNGIYKTSLGKLVKILYIKNSIVKFYNISDVCNIWLSLENIKRFNKIESVII